MRRIRRNPIDAGKVLNALFKARTPDMTDWIRSNQDRIRRVIRQADTAASTLPTIGELDVSEGIVLRDTRREHNEIIKGAPVRFQWSRNQQMWFVPRSRDKRTNQSVIDELIAHFRDAGFSVRLVGAEERAAEAGTQLPVASGPRLRSFLTSTGQLSSTVWDFDPYVQEREDQARAALSFLPDGYRIDRRNSSRYGQVYVFIDSEDRLLTRDDYARSGAPEREAASVAARVAQVGEAAQAAAERRAADRAALLEAARAWRGGPEDLRVYQIDSRQYRSMMGVHQPWISEISPLQFSRMSKRAKAQYQEKRRSEWEISGQAAQRWHDMVEALAVAGDIDGDTPGLSDAARPIVYSAGAARKARAAEDAAAARQTRQAEAAERRVSTTEARMSAADRAAEIARLVSRGVKRETGAVSTSGGMIRYPDDRLASYRVEGRAWAVDSDPYRRRTEPGAIRSGSFADDTPPEQVAEAIFAALRELFPAAGNDYLAVAGKAKKAFGASKKEGQANDQTLTVQTPAGEYIFTLITAKDGFRVYFGRYYSHHNRVPLVTVTGKPPLEALAEAAERSIRWLGPVVEAQLGVNALQAEADALVPRYGTSESLAKYREVEAAKERVREIQTRPA